MKDKKYKIIILIVVIIFILILSLASVYSFFGWQSNDSLVDVTVSSGTGSCTLLSDNNKALEPVSSKEEGRIIKFNGRQEMAPKGTISWNMTINNINNLKHNSFKYELVNETTGVSYKSGDFSTINNGSVIRFQNSEKLSYNTNNTYTLYLWIDGTMGNNPLSMAGSNIDFDMNCDVIGASDKKPIAQYITDLYNKAPKSNVTNNKITYHYADSVSLMNDRLGGTTPGLDDGNIRYYGKSPNNYINFNNELYRIIGVFDGKLKIIRNESIGDMVWDETNNNNWARPATLNTYLNETYYNSIEKSYQDKIVSSTWYLGAFESSEIYSNQVYNYEKNNEGFNNGANPNRSTGKIALMSPSDYGYAVNFNSCTENLFNYDNVNCKGNNWLYVKDKNQWLLAPRSSYACDVWNVNGSGYVGDNYFAYLAYGVRPVFYLNSELSIVSGDGSSSSPYEIK